jgi:hypothetical protein
MSQIYSIGFEVVRLFLGDLRQNGLGFCKHYNGILDQIRVKCRIFAVLL